MTAEPTSARAWLRWAAMAVTLSVASCAPAPRVVSDELARAPRGTVTVIMFTDFQCPFCRRTHAALRPVVRAHAGKVRVVLRHVPLRMHPDARTAARAAVCTESLPTHEDVVDALYVAPDLGERTCEEIAVEHGADRDAFRRCIADPATEARIDGDTAMLDELGGGGVPLLFVGRQRLDGAQSSRALQSAIEAAAHDVP